MISAKLARIESIANEQTFGMNRLVEYAHLQIIRAAYQGKFNAKVEIQIPQPANYGAALLCRTIVDAGYNVTYNSIPNKPDCFVLDITW